MEYIIISVPKFNDSVSRITLNKKQYFIRFTYIDSGDYWTFGLLDSFHVGILMGVKIVPQFPLNLFYGIPDFPDGVFGVLTNEDRVGKEDFNNDVAKFIFIPNQ